MAKPTGAARAVIVAAILCLTAGEATAAGDVGLDKKITSALTTLLKVAGAAKPVNLLVVIRPDTHSEPDRKLLLQVILEQTTTCATKTGLAVISAPDLQAKLVALRTAIRPADVVNLQHGASQAFDAILWGTLSRSRDTRSLRLTLVNSSRVLAQTGVVIDKASLTGLLPDEPSEAEIDQGTDDIAATLDAGLRLSLPAALAAHVGKVGVRVETIEGSSKYDQLTDIVRDRLPTMLRAQPYAGPITWDSSSGTQHSLRDWEADSGQRAQFGFDAVLIVACGDDEGRPAVKCSLETAHKTLWKATIPMDAWDLAVIPSTTELNAKIVKFAEDHLGQQVGDGECWTLANEALIASGGKPADGFVLGRELEPDEPPLPGDIMQFKSVVLQDGFSTIYLGEPDHTAIIEQVLGPQVYGVLEQNSGGRKTVAANRLDMTKMKSGTYKIFRPLPQHHG